MPETSVDPTLARFARLIRDNERLADTLAGLRARTADARAYLDSPGCHRPFGRAHLDRCRAKILACLTLTRANRIEAEALLARCA